MDQPGEGLRLAVNGDEGRSCSVKERSFFLLLREELSEREREWSVRPGCPIFFLLFTSGIRVRVHVMTTWLRSFCLQKNNSVILMIDFE